MENNKFHCNTSHFLEFKESQKYNSQGRGGGHKNTILDYNLCVEIKEE